MRTVLAISGVLCLVAYPFLMSLHDKRPALIVVGIALALALRAAFILDRNRNRRAR
jgi:hypothetical protein